MSAAAGEATWVCGGPDALVESVRSVAPGEVHRGLPDEDVVQRGEGRVVLWAGPGQSDRNAWSRCIALKRFNRCRVWVATDPDDAEADGLGRFCMADAVLRFDGQILHGGESLRVAGSPSGHKRIPVDKLLERLQGELAARADQPGQPLGRPLAEDPRAGLHQKITDSETGLFDGPFASFKLDEEFKRALRFHQPLGLLLIDIGAPDSGLPDDSQTRSDLLVQVAGVFLNECRDIDVLARFTETTFLFLLPGTGPAGTEVLAQRMLGRLQEGALPIVLSPRAGFACAPDRRLADRSGFLAAAEDALIRAEAGSVVRANADSGE